MLERTLLHAHSSDFPLSTAPSLTPLPLPPPHVNTPHFTSTSLEPLGTFHLPSTSFFYPIDFFTKLSSRSKSIKFRSNPLPPAPKQHVQLLPASQQPPSLLLLLLLLLLRPTGREGGAVGRTWAWGWGIF